MVILAVVVMAFVAASVPGKAHINQSINYFDSGASTLLAVMQVSSSSFVPIYNYSIQMFL